MRKKYEEISIQSNIQELGSVQNFIEGICDKYNIDNYFGLLSVAIMEAAENAIKHGNQSDSSKSVKIKCLKIQGGICIRVQDEGKGFDYTRYNSLSEEEGKGEGIFLMRALSNELNFLNKGKVVELTFFIDGIDSTRTLERSECIQKYFQQQIFVNKKQHA